MDWGTIGMLVAALGGLGGLATWIRSRGENQNDERTQLTAEQANFRQAMFTQISELRTQIIEMSKRNDVLEQEGRRQAELVAGLTVRNEVQGEQIQNQAKQIEALTKQNAQQAEQLSNLREEKAAYAQRVQVAESTLTLLKRENAALRAELLRYREHESVTKEGPHA